MFLSARVDLSHDLELDFELVRGLEHVLPNLDHDLEVGSYLPGSCFAIAYFVVGFCFEFYSSAAVLGAVVAFVVGFGSSGFA